MGFMVERVILARPRGYCAGVVMAIDAVKDAALENKVSGEGDLVVYHAIVHNNTVVERLEADHGVRFDRINPAPFGALINLGAGEFLVSASPEMFVRSDGVRIETCPISGTSPRGVDPLGDAEQIRRLLNSQKDEFELNMCTDVDRNDKAFERQVAGKAACHGHQSQPEARGDGRRF